MDTAVGSKATLTTPAYAAQQVNEAYERMMQSDVCYRFVIDMASLK
jgi:D-arabinose 1-dehydrogenase-like Zn-dependent alcohol dehydrogenase